jgi:hypothetical protein
MDRPIVSQRAITLETDILNANRDTMVALGWAMQSVLGVSTCLSGLACSPATPASLSVQIGEGAIYSLQSLEATAYSSMEADTAHNIVKQGLSLDPVLLACPAPTVPGVSVVYLVQAAYQDQDSGSVLNSFGIAQPAQRKGVCVLSIKAGSPAATGTEAAPTVDTGFVGLYTVTVASGQVSVTAANIATVSGAPFITETLTQKISQATADARYATKTGVQQNLYSTAVAGGSADAITAAYDPAITAPTNGMTVMVRAAIQNATPFPTFTPNSGLVPAIDIVKGNGLPLVAGDIAGAGHWLELQYDAVLNKWVLQNPATGVNAQRHGCCRLDKSGENLLLHPYNGNGLMIAGQVQTIPAAGVSLAPTGLTVGTVYYIYAYMLDGVLTLMASASTHTTDAITGVEVMSGDGSKTLVGMAYCDVGPSWVFKMNAVGVLSWFNRRALYISTEGSFDPTTASGVLGELAPDVRVYFMCWADNAVSLYAMTSMITTGPGPQIDYGLGIDSTSVAQFPQTSGAGSFVASSPMFPAAVGGVANYPEAQYHYATPLGSSKNNYTAKFANPCVSGTVWG